jgi:hypothetical protein
MYAESGLPLTIGGLTADRTIYRPEATTVTYGWSLHRKPYTQMLGKDAGKLDKNYGSLGAKVLYQGKQYVTCATHCFVKMPKTSAKMGVPAHVKSAMYDLLRKKSIRKFRHSTAVSSVRNLVPNSPVGKSVYAGWGDTKVSFHF